MHGRLTTMLLAVAAAALMVLADQASKRWAEGELRARGSRALLGGTVVLRHAANHGIVFGLYKGHLHPRKQTLLTLYSAACSAVLALVLAMRSLRQRAAGGVDIMTVGLTALLAGSVGNLWDRATRGWVVDFIDVGLGDLRWPAFNLADLYLGAGLVLCLVGLLRSARGSTQPLR